MKRPIVAIDGPSASGKSSTAGAVAKALGAVHVDSGALYRTLALVAIEAPSREPGEIERHAVRRGAALVPQDSDLVPWLDGQSAESRIRTPTVTALVSEIAAMPRLRDWVNGHLRGVAEPGRLLVFDGRDIGTVVFPDAAVKVFLTASPEVRALRRLRQRGDTVTPELLAVEAAKLAERDRVDSARAIAPLRQAEDATLLDTSELGFDDQVRAIVELVGGRLQPSR